ncbi:MAG TPA: hypothetical protein PLV93_06465, partial [Microthrixaceae bacterium]|nr:hypothetical protein [Microthrixaceae bacterium]
MRATTTFSTITRRRAAAAAATLVLAAATAGATAPPAAGQARLVNALVRTLPERPEPGDDVTVIVGVDGCPVGAVTVELYLTSSDGATQAATLMARAAATTNLLRRTRSVVDLPVALEGWYGVRVLCGNFRPPKEA